MPRKPISEKPMTSEERVRKHRAKFKENRTDLEKAIDTRGHIWCKNAVLYFADKVQDEKTIFKKYKASIPADIRKAVTKISKLEKELAECTTELRVAEQTISSFVFGAMGIDRPSKHDLSKDEVKLLLQLAHPDKHDGSDASIRATKLLNKIKEQSS